MLPVKNLPLLQLLTSGIIAIDKHQECILYIPIFIVPHKDVTVNGQPSSADLWKYSHHTIALHI